MTKLDLTYGIVGNLPLTMKKILHDRRALYAGINENGEYVLLNRGLNSVITIVGASCHITQDYNEDNIPN
ncbi:hypothetical protein HYW75_03415, partial [Candidatus Pacearchaeota archaeon]|nr:hypothetical protein [Candidatus Pacearchaeota archaeon]